MSLTNVEGKRTWLITLVSAVCLIILVIKSDSNPSPFIILLIGGGLGFGTLVLSGMKVVFGRGNGDTSMGEPEGSSKERLDNGGLSYFTSLRYFCCLSIIQFARRFTEVRESHLCVSSYRS
jgi:hypothetical protein